MSNMKKTIKITIEEYKQLLIIYGQYCMLLDQLQEEEQIEKPKEYKIGFQNK